MILRDAIVGSLVLLIMPLLRAEPPQRTFRELRHFEAEEAHQAVAVDVGHFYAINNRSIGKCEKQTGKSVARWKAADDSHLRHLNSGVVLDGKLYCAHSNWPAEPTKNSIEIFEAQTLKHLESRKLPQTDGAVTWIDRRSGHWWIVLAFYGDETSVQRTTLLRLDDNWKPTTSWKFPPQVIQRFVPYSNSGGAWGPDGLLYVTGHDRAEVYAVRVPDGEKTLELVDTIPIEIAGQGIAWDRTDIGTTYGIRRKAKEVVVSRLSHSHEFGKLHQPVKWKRDTSNPILPPSKPGSFDSTRCMNPWVLRQGDQYQLYYSGGDDKGRQRICLATASVDDLATWKRQGPLFEVGSAGAFDASWCVLPHVVQISDERWHLYYTGNAGRGTGLSAFPGMGLATSVDGKTWKKFAENPILKAGGQLGDPDAIGIAGGSVIKVETDTEPQWRFYYTGCPTIGAPLPLNQQKTICLAVSHDGIKWEKRGAVMLRDPNRDYENIGVAGPVVQRAKDGSYRMWYSAIGTRWGYYSICYAESDDGIHWRRGPNYGDSLQLTPQGDGWEKQMVEYPTIITEGDHLRLFYCGNGYGRAGIGTAVGVPLTQNP